MNNTKRRDKKGRVLYTGERQESNGSYSYRYTDKSGQRRKVTSWRLTKSDPNPPRKKFKKSLREMEQEIQADMLAGVYDGEISVLDLVDRYLATKTGVKHNTLASYKFVQNLLAKEPFGQKQIAKVKTSDAKLFLIDLQKNGKGYSTVKTVRGVLRPAFQMAVDDDMLRKNPFAFELVGVVVNDSVRREAISRKEERAFLQFVKNDEHFCKYYDGIYILFKTGLRISEFCGLTMSDIDFEAHTLKIDHQLQRTRNMVYVIEETKTNAGTRIIPMQADVEDAFRNIIQNREKPDVEPVIDGYGGFLFLDKNGMPLIAMHWEKYFQHITEKYNSIYRVQMPKVTPHVCRHTYCSNMAKSGMNPKMLQYLMGHSDIGVTLNTYTHVGYLDAKEELERINQEETSYKKHSKRKIVDF